MEKWVLTGMAQEFRDLVLDGSNATYWHLPTIEQLWDGFRDNRVHWSVLWRFYAFARWRARN